jgi:hypothetical protein
VSGQGLSKQGESSSRATEELHNAWKQHQIAGLKWSNCYQKQTKQPGTRIMKLPVWGGNRGEGKPQQTQQMDGMWGQKAATPLLLLLCPALLEPIAEAPGPIGTRTCVLADFSIFGTASAATTARPNQADSGGGGRRRRQRQRLPPATPIRPLTSLSFIYTT